MDPWMQSLRGDSGRSINARSNNTRRLNLSQPAKKPTARAALVVAAAPALLAVPVNKTLAVPPKSQSKMCSTEIIEISSDSEDDEPVASRTRRRATKTSEFEEKIKRLEQENARVKQEVNEIKKQQAAFSANLEDRITCEICESKLWSPFMLDCGHTFCLQDLEDWFAAALTQHRNVYPHYTVNAPPNGTLPHYTCPKCREKVYSKPIQNFAVKDFVRAAAQEASPQKSVGSAINPCSRFFPQ
ncbi:hypothetical protein B0H19DRAFT_1248093 [Mycena capillaripes]|nr:hypothetical protein B0H19DRAFT_1248093 [Mycena capillaripes]